MTRNSDHRFASNPTQSGEGHEELHENRLYQHAIHLLSEPVANTRGGPGSIWGREILEKQIHLRGGEDETTSLSWAIVSNTTVNFNTNKKSRVRVTFSAVTWCQDSGDILAGQAEWTGNGTGRRSVHG
jgi:hypothetical protein